MPNVTLTYDPVFVTVPENVDDPCPCNLCVAERDSGPGEDEPATETESTPGSTGAYSFAQEEWRYDGYTSYLPEPLRDTGMRLCFLDETSEMYAAALNAAFTFLSSNSNGRYTDRTLMSIRRLAQRAERTQTNGVSTGEFPNVYLVESPYRYDPDTEVKHGGVHGVAVLLSNDELDLRGVLAVRASMRKRGIGKALLSCMPFSASLFVKNNNFPAMRLAASAGFGPVQLNSETNVVQLRRLDNDQGGEDY